MKNQPITVIGIGAFFLWLFTPISTFAQSAGKPDTSGTVPPVIASSKLKLDTEVHLLLGSVSVADFTATLSKQTGLEISAAPYLRERRIVVQMDSVHAADALNSIAELNDWTWRETEPEHIVLMRRVLKVPQDPIYMPRLIQNALPADLREYLKVLRPTEDRRIFRDASLRKPEDVAESSRRLDVATFNALHNLRATLSIEALTKANLPYSKMTARQKTLLLSFYIYDGLGNLNTLLMGDLPPAYTNPGSSLIHFDEQTSNFQLPGFGAYIEPLKEK